MRIPSRSVRLVMWMALAGLLAVSLLGCLRPAAVKPAPIRLGVLPTEDPLPFWAAEEDGLLKAAGLKFKIYTFQSAEDRDAALRAGSIDGAEADLIAAATLHASGMPVKVTTIMLGATSKEGRFGLVVPPGSRVTSITQLADVPIATSLGTIQEYVLDGLMREAGIPESRIKKTAVQKVSVRFELLMSGHVEAAMLPEPLLSLAIQQGARLIASDANGENLSQTVLIFSERYLDRPDGAVAVKKLLGVWDQAGASIDSDPNAFRGLLVEKALLPKPLATTYRLSIYPKHQLPTQQEVEAVLAWMRARGLPGGTLSYSDLVWKKSGG